MSVRFDATSESLYRTANLPTLAGPWTICLWHYHVASSAYGGVVTAFCGNATPAFDGTLSLIVAYNSAGTRLQVFNDNANGALGSTPSLGVWYPIWVTRGAVANRTDIYFDRGSSVDITNTTTFSGTAGCGLGLGGIGGEQNNSRVAAVKWWSAVLSYDEMAAESRCFLPWRTLNLEGCYPCVDAAIASNLVDYSGLARSLTSAGTLTVEDGPPIPWKMGRRRLILPMAAPPPTVTFPGWAPVADARPLRLTPVEMVPSM